MILCPGCKSKLRIRDEYAGKAMKCPRCSASVSVPAEDNADPDEIVEDVAPLAETAAEEVAPIQRKKSEKERLPPTPAKPAPMIKCSECGRRSVATARHCRFCQAPLEHPEELEDAYLPCPRCGAEGPTKVNWTWWGSYLGPRLFHQVSCPQCAHSYNGLSGGSNIGAMIVFITIPLLGIAGIGVALFFILKGKGLI
jgi:hypothetical protein